MANIDWKNMWFWYLKTKSNIRAEYKDWTWQKPTITTDENMNIHMASTCLNYWQECFEWLKAFMWKDWKVRVFRWEENLERMNKSAQMMCAPSIPKDLFFEMLKEVILDNIDYIPPYETGFSLYIRPLLIGVWPQVWLHASKDYMLIIYVNPVWNYMDPYKANNMLIDRNFDRAAPLWTWTVKLGWNYAWSLKSMQDAHDKWFASTLYLDAKEKKYIDECGPANFFAIKDNTYITPESTSILPSITNKSLIEIAKDNWLTVERRKVEVSELATFKEAWACGTAAVISPIWKLFDENMNIWYTFWDGETMWEVSKKLRENLIWIQRWDIEDTHSWVTIL